MIHRLYFLTAALGAAVLTANAAADDATSEFRDGVHRIGIRVRGHVRPSPERSPDVILRVSHERVPDESAGEPISTDSSTGYFTAEEEARAEDAVPDVAAFPGPPGFASTPAVSLDSATGDGSPSARNDEAATVRLTQDEGPPPPPPATVPLPPPESPERASVPQTGTTPPVWTDSVPHGVIDPRYVSSGESSIYVSTCERCGRLDCHCTYAPFGDAVRSAFGRQIHLGSADLMMLYEYDFHPHDTDRAVELTPRGLYQLEKIVKRLQFTPAPIRIEATQDADLDTARRVHVVDALGTLGIADAEDLVVTVRTRAGRPAVEMLETGNGLMDIIRARGRTIRGETSAAFSGTALFGR